jgi:hypothetical protein
MARRAYWATVQRAPGRTYDLRVLARGPWHAWWLARALVFPQYVVMVRGVMGAADQAHGDGGLA